MWLSVRAYIVLSLAVFLIVAKLLQRPKFNRFTKLRVSKILVFIVVLLPGLLVFAPANHVTTNPNAPIYPSGMSWSGPITLVQISWNSTAPLQTSIDRSFYLLYLLAFFYAVQYFGFSFALLRF